MLTVKNRRLNSGLIARLAKEIATKALHDENELLKERLLALSSRVYQAMFGARTLVEAKRKAEALPAWATHLGTEESYNFRSIDSGQTICFYVRFDEPMPLPCAHYDFKHPVGHALFETITAIEKDVGDHWSRLESLRRDLTTQMSKLRDLKAVVEAWPEVAPVINNLLAEGPVAVDVTKPFSALLAKHTRPALTAPDEE